MSCNSCGKGQVIRVERSSGGQSTPIRSVPPRKIGSRKMSPRTVALKPANDLDKHRA